MLSQTVTVAADQRAFQDFAIFFHGNFPDGEKTFNSTAKAAERADRAKPFEVVAKHL